MRTPSTTGEAIVGQAVIEGFEAYDDGSGSVSASKEIIGADISKASGASGAAITVGGQTITSDGKLIKFAKVDKPIVN